MAFLGICKHLLMFKNDALKVYRRKKKTQKVGAVGFDSLQNVYSFFTKVTVSNRKTSIRLCTFRAGAAPQIFSK